MYTPLDESSVSSINSQNCQTKDDWEKEILQTKTYHFTEPFLG